MSMAGGAHALLIGLASLLVVACGSSRPGPFTRPADAAPAPAGETRSGASDAEIGQPAPGARIAGHLVAQDGRPLLSGAVILSSLGGDEPVALPIEDVTIRPDGSFEFRNVPPGTYEIRARGETEPNGTSLFATFRVIADGRDLNNLDLTLVPGATLTGEVIVERMHAPATPGLESVVVRAPMADGSSFGDVITGRPAPNGAFGIRGLMPGTHAIRLEGLQPPWVLKSVILRGRDITDIGIETEPGQRITDVRVTITNAATDVSGTVRDAQGQAAPDALVLLAPLSPQFWNRTSRRIGLLRTDASGHFRIRGLPAGEYRAIASAALDETDAFRTERLQRIIETGLPVSLEPLEALVIDLPLTGAGASPEPGR